MSNVRTAFETLRYIVKGSTSSNQGFKKFVEYGLSEKISLFIHEHMLILCFTDTILGSLASKNTIVAGYCGWEELKYSRGGYFHNYCKQARQV